MILLQTAEFAGWLAALDDKVAKSRILARIKAARAGNFGDCRPVGEGVSEMRIHHGPGYRVYFKRVGDLVCLLLCAGVKGTQSRDISRARRLARAWGAANED